MDYKHCHHVVEASNQLPHDSLHDARAYLIVLKIHNFLQIVAVAQLHEDVVPGICLNSFSHFYNILA